MAYDEQLVARIQILLKEQRGLDEKKMFGGLAYMAHGKMVAGTLGPTGVRPSSSLYKEETS